LEYDGSIITNEMFLDWIYPYYLRERAQYISNYPIELDFKPLQIYGNQSNKIFSSGLIELLLKDKMSKQMEIEFKKRGQIKWET